MKEINLKNAEVVTQYQSQETYKTKDIDGGTTIVSFSVKTKINDRAEKSPVVFDNCTKFCKTKEEVSFLKNLLIAGNIIDIAGRADRQKDAKSDKYYDKVIVDSVTIISGRQAPAAKQNDDDLPF